MKKWFQTASRRGVVIRALKTAAVVGVLLITINHGDALLRGEFSSVRLFKMGLTFCVPYMVATFSSVGAIHQLEKDAPV